MIVKGPKGAIANLMNSLEGILGCLLLFFNSFFTLGSKESNAYKKEEID